MKKTTVIIFGVLLGLAGCQHELRTDRHVVVQPPAGMMSCPVTQLPETKNLTDRDVARLIARLYRDNMTCRQAMDAVKQYLQDAQGKIDREES